MQQLCNILCLYCSNSSAPPSGNEKPETFFKKLSQCSFDKPLKQTVIFFFISLLFSFLYKRKWTSFTNEPCRAPRRRPSCLDVLSCKHGQWKHSPQGSGHLRPINFNFNLIVASGESLISQSIRRPRDRTSGGRHGNRSWGPVCKWGLISAGLIGPPVFGLKTLWRALKKAGGSPVRRPAVRPSSRPPLRSTPISVGQNNFTSLSRPRINRTLSSQQPFNDMCSLNTYN